MRHLIGSLKERMRRDEYSLSRLWAIAEAALEYFIAIVTTGAYLAKITSALNFSDSLTGILASFVSLGCIFQLGSSALFRKTARVKRRVIVFQMIHQLLFAVVYLTPVLPCGQNMKTGAFLAAYVTAYVLINLVRSQKNNWLLSLVDDGKRGTFTANKEIVSLLGGMLFSYVMGSAIDRFEYAGNQTGAFILCAVVIFAINALHAVSLILTKEKPLFSEDTNDAQKSMASVLRNKRVMRVMLIGVLWYVANYAATPFYGAYQIKELNFSMRFISVLSIAYSIIRALVSPFMGKLADRHGFVKMAFLCFAVAAAGFVSCAFTTPSNGKILFFVYNILNAVSMAGINSAILNIVFGYAPAAMRAQAIALNQALCGVSGFLTTCIASGLVSHIQKNGNMILGVHLYPQQLVSMIAAGLTAVLLVYTYFGVIKKEAHG